MAWTATQWFNAVQPEAEFPIDLRWIRHVLIELCEEKKLTWGEACGALLSLNMKRR